MSSATAEATTTVEHVTIGTLVARYRNQRRMTKTHLATITGISRKELWRIETDRVQPLPSVMARLIAGLDLRTFDANKLRALVATEAMEPPLYGHDIWGLAEVAFYLRLPALTFKRAYVRSPASYPKPMNRQPLRWYRAQWLKPAEDGNGHQPPRGRDVFDRTVNQLKTKKR